MRLSDYEEYTNSEVLARIKEYIHRDRDRKIIADYLLNRITYEKIAEKYELSVTHVKRIVYKCESIVLIPKRK